jgi:heme/copper-type cytochrome/quinol oxidase subunit 2
MQMDVIIESQAEYDIWMSGQKAFIAEELIDAEKVEKQMAVNKKLN